MFVDDASDLEKYANEQENLCGVNPNTTHKLSPKFWAKLSSHHAN